MAAVHEQFGVRFMKAGAERLAQKVGRRIGKQDLFQSVGSWLNRELGGRTAHLTMSLAGMLGAAGMQAPDWLTEPFVRTGLDRNIIRSILEEAFDAGIQETARSMESEGRRLTDQEGDNIFNRILNEKIGEEGTLKGLIESLVGKKVLVNVNDHTIHDQNCPMCWKGTNENRKKGEDAVRRTTTYQAGIREVPIEWALTNEYIPTNGRCCGKSVQATAVAGTKAPKSVAECVTAFRTDLDCSLLEKTALKDGYYAMVTGATPEQQKLLRDIGERKVWQTQEIADYLVQSDRNLESFLKLLQTRQLPDKLVAKGALAWLNANRKSLLGAPQPGADNDVDRIRDGVLAYTNRLKMSVRDKRSARLRKKYAP